MIKKIFGFIVGLIVALIVLVGIEELGHSIFPVPQNLDYTDHKIMTDFIKTLAPMTFVFVLFAHFLSAFIGSLITSIISKTNGVLGLSIGGLVFVGAITNIIMLPFQPIWFVILDILLTFTGAWFAFKIAFNVYNHSQK